jgi:hypothetical protein
MIVEMKTRSSRGLTGTRAKLGLTKRCPKGYILRAPYTRKFKPNTKQSGYNIHRKGKTFRVYPKSGSTTVKASCIKDRGLAGKGPRSGKGISIKHQGDLVRYGYNAHKSSQERHASLKKAIEVYGSLRVFRKLDAIAKLTMRTAPEAHRIFTSDRNWVQKNFPMKEIA